MTKFQEAREFYRQHGYNVEFARVRGMGSCMYHFTKIGQDLKTDFREYSVCNVPFYGESADLLFDLGSYFKSAYPQNEFC